MSEAPHGQGRRASWSCPSQSNASTAGRQALERRLLRRDALTRACGMAVPPAGVALAKGQQARFMGLEADPLFHKHREVVYHLSANEQVRLPLRSLHPAPAPCPL